MADKKEFEEFKEKIIKENEEQYGSEIRKKYGDETIDESNAKLKNMSKEQHDEIIALSNEIIDKLKQAFKQKDPTSELAQEVAKLHKKWICFYWADYSKEAHLNLANMYAQDERFRKYYDVAGMGASEFLRDAIKFYINE